MVERRKDKMFKRAFLFLLMLSLLLGGMGMSGATTTGAIKIGLMGTFKGSLERQGIDMRDDALLALDQFQQNAKGQSLQRVVANDKGDPPGGSPESGETDRGGEGFRHRGPVS
jgi:ABC-type branched-subunit amino acid transport system substrate-binding protein